MKDSMENYARLSNVCYERFTAAPDVLPLCGPAKQCNVTFTLLLSKACSTLQSFPGTIQTGGDHLPLPVCPLGGGKIWQNGEKVIPGKGTGQTSSTRLTLNRLE